MKDLGGGEGGPPRWCKISGTLQKLAREPDEPDINWDEDVNEITPVKGDGSTRKPGLARKRMS